MAARQGVITKRAINSNPKAKYKLTYRTVYSQKIRNNTLSYTYSKSTNLSYKGN